MRHHEILLRQDIKSNYRNTAGTILLNLFINTNQLRITKKAKRQTQEHKEHYF